MPRRASAALPEIEDVRDFRARKARWTIKDYAGGNIPVM
jgi:hypothetical protein